MGECERVMSAVRCYGWRGLSILWHDTVFGGAQISKNIGNIYWQVKRANEQWMNARSLVKKIWYRFSQAGLFPEDGPSPLYERPQ